MKKVTILLLLCSYWSCTNLTSTTTSLPYQPCCTDRIPTHLQSITNFPIITDTLGFLDTLLSMSNLCKLNLTAERLFLSDYRKIYLSGSLAPYFLAEINYGDSESGGSCFPFQYQLLFNTKGKHIQSLNAYTYRLIEIFPNQHPFLLTLHRTSKGNGGHHLYQIIADTLCNVYDGYINFDTRTYDKHHDEHIYEPYELNLSIKDYNEDGYNDLIFSGLQVWIEGEDESGEFYGGDYSAENPFKKEPIQFVYLYNIDTGRFEVLEE